MNIVSVLLEKALGSYHKPSQPIPESVVVEVSDSVHDLTRRFFHHLLRYINIYFYNIFIYDLPTVSNNFSK